MAKTTYFLDTSFIFALLNSRNQWHSKALQHQLIIQRESRPILTTEFILTEIADGLSAVKFRGLAAAAINSLISDSLVTIVPTTSSLFRSALNFFEARQDKIWGLTDCSSFVVMTDYGVTEALTSDDDFRQAGFKALMLD